MNESNEIWIREIKIEHAYSNIDGASALYYMFLGDRIQVRLSSEEKIYGEPPSKEELIGLIKKYWEQEVWCAILSKT